MLSDIEKNIVKFGKENGKNDQEILSALTKHRQAQSVAPETAKQGIVQETAQDVTDTVLNVGNSVGGIFNKSMDVVENKNFTVPEKIMGVFGKVAGGISNAIGDVITGAGKAVISQSAEDKLKEITQNVAQGVAKTDTAKSVIDWYGGLNEHDKLFVDSVGGVASFISDVYAPGVAKTVTKPIISGSKTAIKTGEEVIQKGIETAKPIVTKAGEIAGGTADVGKGIVTQVKDATGRIITGAKDTAEESRRLASLPVPEAKLIRTGFDDAGVKFIKESTPAERNVYRELAAKAKTASGDLMAEPPKIVAGKEFMKPVTHLLSVRNSSGARLGAIRKNLSNAPLDVTNEWKQFRAYLDGRGITVNKNGKFTGAGNMAKSDLAELQKMYDELRPNSQGKVLRSQKWIDEWSQRTFKEYDLRQAREQSFSDDVVKTVEKARNIFKQGLPKEYRVASQDYSASMGELQKVAKLLGYKGDIEKLTAKEMKAAEVAYRIIGGASDRPQAVIDEVLATAQKYGYKSDVDLKKVIIFADALEDIYPNITPKRGLTGSVSRGVNQTGAGVAGDIATGNIKGVLGQMLSSTASQKEVQQALDEFLKSFVTKK